MTAQQECSQCLLVEMESTISPHTFLGDNGEYGYFDMTLNDDVICSTRSEHSEVNDLALGSCSAVVDAIVGNIFEVYLKKNFKYILISWNKSNIYSSIPGDEVQVVYVTGADTTPLFTSLTYLYNGFNGFRI